MPRSIAGPGSVQGPPAARVLSEVFDNRALSYTRSIWHIDLATRFVSWLALPPYMTVLDVATGTGLVALTMADAVGHHAHIHGVDISPGMVRIASGRMSETRSEVSFSVGDAHRLAIHDGSIDIVTCVAALHYMSPLSAMREFIRVLRPGGILALATICPGQPKAFRIFQQLMGRHRISIPERSAVVGEREAVTAMLSRATGTEVEVTGISIYMSDSDLDDAWTVHSEIYSKQLRQLADLDIARLREKFMVELAAARAKDDLSLREVEVLFLRSRLGDRHRRNLPNLL